MQGLAFGGEYGSAAAYVAEHSPAGKRGYYTCWIQATSTIGLLVALGVIMLVKLNMPDADFIRNGVAGVIPFGSRSF